MRNSHGLESRLTTVGVHTEIESCSSELRILSLSCVYPSSRDPGMGLFVQSRLRYLSKLAQVKVVAPIAEIDYAKLPRRSMGRGTVPARWWDGKIEGLHPLWLFLPGGRASMLVSCFFAFFQLWLTFEKLLLLT